MSKSIIDSLLDFGACFDWMTPAAAYLNDAKNGGTVADFGVSAHNYHRGFIQRILGDYNIESWGYMLVEGGNTLMFTVRRNDAKMARFALSKANVHLLYDPNVD